jgi:hypothetical protein
MRRTAVVNQIRSLLSGTRTDLGQGPTTPGGTAAQDFGRRGVEAVRDVSGSAGAAPSGTGATGGAHRGTGRGPGRDERHMVSPKRKVEG